MQTLWLAFMLIFGIFPDAAPQKENHLVIKEKEITVSGNTSFGKFECTYYVNTINDTLSFSNNFSTDQFQFEIPVGEFACGNFLLNRDFKKTIKAEDYPKAHVKVANLSRRNNRYTCDLYLELVGKKLHFKEFKLVRKGDRLLGNLTLDFALLDLEPPSRLGGLIKVDEELHLFMQLTS